MKYLPAEKVLPPPDSISEAKQIPEATGDFINVEMGLEYSAGMTDLYKEILMTFNQLREDKQKKIQAAFDAQDWKNYTIYVHALKSTALSIGGEKTSEAAKKLESAGKILTSPSSSEQEKHEGKDFISKNHAAAMKLYDKLAEEAKKLAETL